MSESLSRDQRSLLERILDTPGLPRIVPHLEPQLLHRVIEHCGLEDCGELVALATPEQLSRVFDLDLWHASRPGLDEQFDARRFGVWLEVLADCGASVAAQKLAGMEVGAVVAGFAQHVRVFDVAAVTPYTTSDALEVTPLRSVDDGLSVEVAGYMLVARRPDAWDAIVSVLTALEAEHPVCFRRVMRACKALSNSRPEVDGLDELLDAPEQAMFDLAFDRERRREKQGYATPAQARAFIQQARHLRPERDPMPTANPVARAYFRSIEEAATEEADAAAERKRLSTSADARPADDSAGAVAALVDMLREAGALAGPPRALLEAPKDDEPRLARIRTYMQAAREADPAAFLARSDELAYLVNVLLSGCSVQARPFTPQEASDAAVAVCNLGLEHWPARWPAAGDLIGVFQLGWSVLHEHVCLYAAGQLIDVLGQIRCPDRETRHGLDMLRREMRKCVRAGEPWGARDALDVIAILDTPAWAALLGLLDQCPVMHAAMGASRGTKPHSVSASAFEFISDDTQLAVVREFMESLAERLV